MIVRVWTSPLKGREHRLIKTQIGHARDFTWYRGQRPSPARVILSHERVQIHSRENLWVTRQIHHTFACVSCYCATFRLQFNHARRGRALAAISGKVPSVSGVWSRILLPAVRSSRRVKPSRKIALNSNGEVNCRELARRPWKRLVYLLIRERHGGTSGKGSCLNSSTQERARRSFLMGSKFLNCCMHGWILTNQNWITPVFYRQNSYLTPHQPRGAPTWKGGTGMSGGQDPCLCLSRRSLDPQLQHDSVL